MSSGVTSHGRGCTREHLKKRRASFSQGHFPDEETLLLKTRRDRERVLGFPPTPPLPRPHCSIGKLKKTDEFSYTHLCRLILQVRQSLFSLLPTHRLCCSASALEPLLASPRPATGWGRHRKPTLIALASMVSLGLVPEVHWHRVCFHRCAELWLFPAHAQPRWGSAARAPWAVLWWVSPPCLAGWERLWLLLPSQEACCWGHHDVLAGHTGFSTRGVALCVWGGGKAQN